MSFVFNVLSYCIVDLGDFYNANFVYKSASNISKKEHRKKVYKKIKMEKETDVRTTVNNLKNSYALT